MTGMSTMRDAMVTNRSWPANRLKRMIETMIRSAPASAVM